MSGEHHVFVGIALDIGNYVAGHTLVFILRNHYLCGLYVAVYNFDGVLGVDIYAEYLFALAYVGAKLAAVDISVGIVCVAVVGDKAHCARFKDIAVSNQMSISEEKTCSNLH